METLRKFMELRRGIILVGNITEKQIYESYRRYAIQRDGYALSFEAVRPYIQLEIWQIRLWWGSVAGFHAEEYFANLANLR